MDKLDDANYEHVVRTIIESVGGEFDSIGHVKFPDYDKVLAVAGILLKLGMLNQYMPEGCTPKDADVLRKANHEFAQREHERERNYTRTAPRFWQETYLAVIRRGDTTEIAAAYAQRALQAYTHLLGGIRG